MENLILHVLVFNYIFQQETWIDSLVHHLDAVSVVVFLPVAIGGDGRLLEHLFFLKELLQEELFATPKVFIVPVFKNFGFYKS